MPKLTISRSPHFWIILLLIAGLAAVYYYGKANLSEIRLFWFKELIYLEYINSLNGSLFVIPFLYATLVYWWRGALTVLLVSEAIMMPYIHYMAYNTESFARNIIYSFVPFLVIGLITLELKLREKERKTAAERETERQSYMSQVFKAQENERQRIAQELHDDTLQMLYVIANRARSLAQDETPPVSGQKRVEMEWIRDSILKVAEDIRKISLDLRPSILDELSLIPALRWLIDRLNQDGGPHIQMTVKGRERKIGPETEVMIFRIIQEALSNARKHSGASEIRVSLEFTSDSCGITVQDNGKGFLLPPKTSCLVSEGKLGLAGMQKRAEFLGGTLDIISAPDAGTTISLRVKA